MLNDMIKTVFMRLNYDKTPATPDMYRKYFCEEAKKHGIYTENCNSIEVLKESLSLQDQMKLEELNIDTMDSLLHYLSDQLEKPKKSNIDHETILLKTTEITSILANITQSLNRSITASKDGDFNISQIKNEIDKLDVAGFESDEVLQDLKSQFLNIADSIQSETKALSTVLSDESNKVVTLEDKIQKLEKQLKDAKKQSNTDFLTGALTRKAFDEKLNTLEKEFSSESKDYSVIFFDLDYFKKINDTYGHDAGDKVLSTFSKLLLKEFKNYGHIARYGGEEFVAICPEKTIEECFQKAQMIREILHKANFVYDQQKIKVTYSGGICQRSTQDHMESMLKHADKLLYEAKKNGRDRIEI